MLEIVPRHFPRPPHGRPRWGGYGPRWGGGYYYDTPRYVDVEVVSMPPALPWRVVATVSGKERVFYGPTATAALKEVPPRSQNVQLQRWNGAAWQSA